MINAIINGLLNVINGIINVIFLPIDAAINAAFPDISNNIVTALNSIQTLFSNLSYPLTFLPKSFITILLAIFTIQLAKVTLGFTYKGFIKLYVIIQKIKFW